MDVNHDYSFEEIDVEDVDSFRFREPQSWVHNSFCRVGFKDVYFHPYLVCDMCSNQYTVMACHVFYFHPYLGTIPILTLTI